MGEETKERIYAPEDAQCGKCGLPLAFKKLDSGKWCPTNPDGSDHWDICREVYNKKMGITLINHKFGGTTNPRNLKPEDLYQGDAPPW